MNPDLFDKLPRERQVGIRQNLMLLKQRGASAKEIASYLRDDENVDPNSVNPSYLKGLFTAAAQGATFNLADEAIAGLGATHPLNLLNDKPVFDPNEYASIRDDIRGVDKQFAGEHPIANAAAGVVGGLATGGLLPGGAAKTIGKAALKGAAGGAAYGGLAGVGAGEDASDRLIRGGLGAGIGAGLGTVVPGSVGLYRSMRNPAVIAGSKIDEGIQNSGGIDALMQQLDRYKKTGRGDIVTPADLTPSMREGADFAANINPKAREALRNVHDARQADVGNRMLGDTQDALTQGGLPPDANAEARIAQNVKKTRAFADSPEGYAGIEEANPKFDLDQFSDVLSKPTIKAAWKQARVAGDLTASDPVDQLLQAITKSNPGLSAAEAKAAAAATRAAAMNDAAKHGIELSANLKKPDVRNVTFSDLQQLADALGDRSNAAWKAGKGKLGAAYSTLQDAVKEGMAKTVPNYPQVDAIYGAHKDLERLVQEGVDWWNKADSRLLNERVQQLSQNPARLQEFRVGIASELLKQLDNAQTNTNVANKIMASSSAMQRKLEVIFGSKDVLDQFMEKAALEKNMSRLGEAVSGSPTARRTAERDAVDAVVGAAHGPASAISSGAHLASKAIKRGAQRDAGGLMGQFLATQGAPNIEKLLQQWTNRTPELLSPFAAKASRSLVYGGTQGVGSLFNMF